MKWPVAAQADDDRRDHEPRPDQLDALTARSLRELRQVEDHVPVVHGRPAQRQLPLRALVRVVVRIGLALVGVQMVLHVDEAPGPEAGVRREHHRGCTAEPARDPRLGRDRVVGAVVRDREQHERGDRVDDAWRATTGSVPPRYSAADASHTAHEPANSARVGRAMNDLRTAGSGIVRMLSAGLTPKLDMVSSLVDTRGGVPHSSPA